MPFGPSRAVVDAKGEFGWDRTHMTQPFSWVRDIKRLNTRTGAFEAFECEWTDEKNDPASLLFNHNGRRTLAATATKAVRKAKHFGYTPTEPGTYLLDIGIEGLSSQVIGAAWFGGQATVTFKNLASGYGYKPEIKYFLDKSTNKFCFRPLHSMLECNRIEVTAVVESIDQPIYFFPCFTTTPVTKIFTSGVFTQFNVRPEIQEPTGESWIVKERGEADGMDELGNSLFDARETTGDCVLVASADGARFKAHKAVLAAKSDMLSCLVFNPRFRESLEAKEELNVDGDIIGWKLVLSYMYTKTWFKLIPFGICFARHMLLALDVMEFYGMPEAMRRAAIDRITVIDQASVLPLMVYAWRQGDHELMDRVVHFIDEHIERIVRSTEVNDITWLQSFNQLKYENQHIGPVLTDHNMAATVWASTDSSTGDMWKQRLPHFFTLPTLDEDDAATQEGDKKRKRVTM